MDTVEQLRTLSQGYKVAFTKHLPKDIISGQAPSVEARAFSDARPSTQARQGWRLLAAASAAFCAARALRWAPGRVGSSRTRATGTINTAAGGTSKTRRIMQVFAPIAFKQWTNWPTELGAGVTTAVVALPLAMAFGVTSGVGPLAGLYGAIFTGFFAALFGGTPAQVTGPTGPMAVIMATIYAKYADPTLVFIVVAMAGVIQITMGVLRLGGAIRLVPRTVLSGFMTGIGGIIFSLQLPVILGHAGGGQVLGALQKVPFALANLNGAALGIGLFTLFMLYKFPARLTFNVPRPLLALVSAGMIDALLLAKAGISVPALGAIPQGLPALHLPVVSPALLVGLAPAAITLAVLGAVDSLLTSLVADSMTSTFHDSDRELVGQGIGNTVAGLFGGHAGAGATMRTVVNVRTGGRTPISGATHSLVLLMTVLGLGSLARFVPLSCLAAILIKSGLDVVDWGLIRRSHKLPVTEVVVLLATFLTTVFVDLIVAVAAGWALAILASFYQSSKLQLSPNGLKVFTSDEGAEAAPPEIREALKTAAPGAAAVVCLRQSPEHVQWFRLSVFGLMVYGVGIPCFLFVHLYRIRDRLMHLAIRRHFGFFYNGFEPNFYYFEAVYMLRKLLVLLALAIPTKTLRFLVMVALGLAFLGLHVRCEPFDDRDFFVLDRLELLSLTSFLFSCLAGLWFSYLEALPESMPGFTEFTRSEGFTAAITALVASCHTAFILLAAWGLVRNIIVRHFRFLEECFPEHLSPLQKWILWCLDGRFHHVKLNPDTRELDTSQLSSDERRFLHSALSDTMAAYITAAVRSDRKVERKRTSRFRRTRRPPDDDSADYHRFFPGHMVAAIRLAMKRVEYSRLLRAEEYEAALDREGVEQHVTWLGKSFKRFKALLSASYASARNEIKQHVSSSVRSTIQEKIEKSKFVSWIHKPHTALDLHRMPSGGSLTAEQRAAASMFQLGVSVEDLHLGLMLSWMDIAVGKAEYFILETKEDRERAFEREVLEAKGTTWNEDVSFVRLFKSLDLRKRLAEAEGSHKICLELLSEEEEEDEDKPCGDEGPDPESLLGKKATQEQAFAQALRQKHAELVVETLELRTQLQELQKKMTVFMSDSQAPSRMGDRSSDEWPSEDARNSPRVLSQASRSASRSSTGVRQGSAPPTLRTSAAAGQHIPKEPDPATPPADGPPEPATTPAKGMRLPLQAISAWPSASALAAARLSMRPRSSPPNDSTPDGVQLPVHSRDSTVQSRGSAGSSSAAGNDPPRATALFSALIPRAEGKLASMGRLLELRSASAASTEAGAPPAPLQPQPPGPPPAGP